jgi:hypothetical protein
MLAMPQLSCPINSDYALPDEWSRYIKRMMHKPPKLLAPARSGFPRTSTTKCFATWRTRSAGANEFEASGFARDWLIFHYTKKCSTFAKIGNASRARRNDTGNVNRARCFASRSGRTKAGSPTEYVTEQLKLV